MDAAPSRRVSQDGFLAPALFLLAGKWVWPIGACPIPELLNADPNPTKKHLIATTPQPLCLVPPLHPPPPLSGSLCFHTMASPASETVPLQFEPFTCRVEVEFWFDLERRKLHEYKDDVSPVAVWGSYATSSHAAIPSFVTLGVDAFGSCNALPFHFPVEVFGGTNGQAGPLC